MSVMSEQRVQHHESSSEDDFAVASPFVAHPASSSESGFHVDNSSEEVWTGTSADRHARVARASAAKAEHIAIEVSDLLFSVYNSEEGLVGGLSMGETRIIQFVGDETLGQERSVTVSAIAAAVEVKGSSATASVNKLVRKGLLTKTRSKDDARCVNVALTGEGTRLYRVRQGFYRNMARAITKGMSSRDVDLLLVALGRLERFYRSDRTNKSSKVDKSEHTSDSSSARRMGDEGRA